MADQRGRGNQPNEHQGIRSRSHAQRLNSYSQDGNVRYAEQGGNNDRNRIRTSAGGRTVRSNGQSAHYASKKPKRNKSFIFLKIVLILLMLIIAGVLIYGALRQETGKGSASSGGTASSGNASESAVTDEYGNVIRSEADRAADNTLSADQKIVLGIKSSLESGTSVMETLRKYYPNDLILYKNKRYVFTPVNDSLKKHSYKAEDLKQSENGEWQYTDGDKITSHKGIDVSSHQGDIDWAKVKGSGVEFAMIRALYRGYSSGKLVEDEKFKNNITGADANGIKAGVYIFTQAVNESEVDEEIAMLKELVGENKVDYPVVVDVEEANAGEGRMDTLGIEERTSLIKYYCEKIKDAGYKPMKYFNIESALLMLDLTQLEDYDKWLAAYNSEFYYPYQYTLRQYSDSGSVDGIEGNVDLDISFVDY